LDENEETFKLLNQAQNEEVKGDEILQEEEREIVRVGERKAAIRAVWVEWCAVGHHEPPMVS
jgi:hypothetical protein